MGGRLGFSTSGFGFSLESGEDFEAVFCYGYGVFEVGGGGAVAG